MRMEPKTKFPKIRANGKSYGSLLAFSEAARRSVGRDSLGRFIARDK